MKSPTTTNKRKIDQFFTRKEEPDDKKSRKSSSSALDGLKCPTKAVFEDENQNGEKRAVKRRSMRNLGKSQMILDFGQKTIGCVTCEKCGMMYSVDAAEDVRAHVKFHERWENRYEIPRTFVQTFLRLKSRILGDYNVYHVANFVEEGLKKKFNEHMKHVDEDIGYKLQNNDIWSADKRIFFIFLSRNQKMYMGGICVIEKIQKAWTDVSRREVTDGSDMHDWIVGVDRIWVDPTCRRKGVAMSLLDAATTQDRHMEFRARRLRVAFSDPSDEGRVLAKKFIETRYKTEDQFDGEILVY